MVDCTKNLYELLEVSTFASRAEIKLAYKKLVRLYHPDLNKSKDAEIHFKLLNNAYNILCDEEKKQIYDKLLNITKPEQTIDKNSILKQVKITETEAYYGTNRTVNILNRQKCPKCMGKKFINALKCPFCLGKGEKSEHRKLDVFIPPQTKSGDTIFVDKINSSALYDKKLFLKILIEPLKKVYKKGFNKFVDVQIPLYDAILGVNMEINVEGAGLLSFTIPPLSAPEDKIELCENYFANIIVIFPKTLSDEEKNLYDKIKILNLKKADYD